MTSILIASAICLLVPGLVLYRTLRASPDLPAPEVPQADLSRWERRPRTPHEAADAGPPPDTFRRSYFWFNALLLPAFFLIVAALTVGWSLVLFVLYRQRIDALPPSAYLVEPGWGFCVVPALFLGIFTSAFPVDMLARLALGDRYEDYMGWERGRLGLERRAAVCVMCGLGLLIAVPLALGVAFGMDWYAHFGEDEVTVNQFWGFGERAYPYSRVKRLVRATHLRAPSGEIRKRDRLFILFDDGTRWCNEDVVQSGPHLKRDEEVIRFVSRKSGRPVEEHEFIEDAK